MNGPSEIGGGFHWMPWLETGMVAWPEPNTLYSLGRDAVQGVWETLAASREPGTLFVPDYFCHEVTRAWVSSGITVLRYFDNPALSHPRWDDLNAAGPGDVVLAVNYFGIRPHEPWIDWRAEHPGPVLIEDHSHDPGSSWALHSRADYAFASLRKVLPVPEGAVVWSPQGHVLPAARAVRFPIGSALKLAAMLLKGAYLDGCPDPERTKDRFRDLQAEGERRLAMQALAGPAPWGRASLVGGYPPQWRERRETNVRRLLDLLEDQTPGAALFRSWPSGHCPFAAVLLFPSPELRELARGRLIAADVYPTVLWTMDRQATAESRDLAGRILCLPADQRYGRSDMERIREVLSEIDWGAEPVDDTGVST
jgi:hypothetical protein